MCVVAEQIEETETFKIVVNVCDEKSNWTYTEVCSLIIIINREFPYDCRSISSAGLTPASA